MNTGNISEMLVCCKEKANWRKPFRCEKTKLQAATVFSLWFCNLLDCILGHGKYTINNLEIFQVFTFVLVDRNNKYWERFFISKVIELMFTVWLHVCYIMTTLPDRAWIGVLKRWSFYCPLSGKKNYKSRDWLCLKGKIIMLVTAENKNLPKNLNRSNDP